MRRTLTTPEQEAGFTLIELLVVIIIIGILAAIAIPIFLNQRNKAYDSAARSDLKSLADSEETLLLDIKAYGTIADLISNGEGIRVSPNVTIEVVRYDDVNGYCLAAQHAASATKFYWDSGAGGLQPTTATNCPVTTSGVAGDSLTG